MLQIKRIHDRGKSGWFCFLQLIPIVHLWVWIELFILKGKDDLNKHGEFDELLKKYESSGRMTSLFLAGFIAQLIAITHAAMPSVASAFKELFTGFGVDLPYLTMFFLKHHVLYLVLPTLWLFALGGVYKGLTIPKGFFYLSLALVICFFVAFIISLYYPVFLLGSEV